MGAGKFIKWAGFAALAGAAAAVCYKVLKDNSETQKAVVLEYSSDDMGFEPENVELTDADRLAADMAFDELEARQEQQELPTEEAQAEPLSEENKQD